MGSQRAGHNLVTEQQEEEGIIVNIMESDKLKELKVKSPISRDLD